MKIGIDAHTLGSRSSGNENYYLQLLRDLGKHRNGDRYVVYYSHLDGLAKIPSVDHFVLKRIRPASPFVRIPVSFPVEFRREKLDVFHAQFIVPPFCNCKSVTTIPDIIFERYPECFPRFEALRSKMLVPWSARRADHIITVSNFSKNEIVNTYHIHPDKITVIDEAPRDEFRVLSKEHCQDAICNKYHLSPPFILYVGRLQPRKNLSRLVEAFTMLFKRGIAEKLVLVGRRDWRADELLSCISEPVRAKVVVTGYVDWDDLPLFYNAAELFVFPSICEGFGAPVLEAMACGCPVVTSYGSSLEEVAGGAAILSDPYSVNSIADAILAVLSSSDLKRSLRQKGLERAAEFSGQRKAAQTITVYQRAYS